VSVAGKQFAVPLQDIHHVGHFAKDQISAEDGLSLLYEDKTVVVTNMSYYLQLAGKADTVLEDQDGMLVILFNVGDDLVGAAVDAVVEQREIIVKDLGSHLTHVHGVSGVTVTGTGELIPILNLRELVDLPESTGDTEVAAASGMILDEPLKVLIVDDSISVRHSVARMIESQSWMQQQAVDGMDALAKLEVFVPDVIILDIEMPRMNGYEFKAHINNHPLWVDIPIIMLTSRASEKHQQKAKELGIDLYMTKPYQDTAFIQMLEDIRTS
jgi:chemosensory pili system protein ChpA (sensor histidine kinase/response regulator)